MRISRTAILVLILLLCIQVVQANAWEIDETAYVTTVTDGDTFRISNDRVRLADIQAPENGIEPGYSIAKNALSSLVGGKTVYLDTDQKSGRDQFGRLVAVVYVRVNSTHYLNVNKALLIQQVVVEDNFTNNEFNPSDWTLYVKYADAESATTSLLYLSIALSSLALIITVVTLSIKRNARKNYAAKMS